MHAPSFYVYDAFQKTAMAKVLKLRPQRFEHLDRCHEGSAR